MKLTFLANPASPHVRQWIDLLAPTNDIEVFCIGEDWSAFSYPEQVKIVALLHDLFSFLPKPLRYMLLGLTLRSKKIGSCTLHAHNTSGYGLAALLSGHRYFVTTYGSEIFDSPSKSKLFRFLLKLILNHAAKITATSEAMKWFLVEKFNISPVKIRTFSLGVSQEFEGYLPQDNVRNSEEITWFANRRILPLYHTLEIVNAFLEFKSQGGGGKLWLLQGDSSGEYLERVRDRCEKNSTDIVLIEKFLPPQELRELLRKSHFTISIPDSDQLSSSILEGMSQGAVPILRELESYRGLTSALFFTEVGTGGLDIIGMFEKTSKLAKDEFDLLSKKCVDQVKENYSSAAALSNYLAQYWNGPVTRTS